MRARLRNQSVGDEFHFLCLQKMAERMDRVVDQAGGEIFHRDTRSYGVVLSVRKVREEPPSGPEPEQRGDVLP